MKILKKYSSNGVQLVVYEQNNEIITQPLKYFMAKKQSMALQVLTYLDFEHKCLGTKMPVNYIPKTTFTDKTANGLTKCIVRWIQLNGYQAERISTTGRYIDNSKIVTDVLGFQKKIGSGKYIKGSGTNGSADISATIKGKSVKIEVKIGNDRQSEAQKIYQKNIENAGGIYYIAKDFDTFLEFYKTLI